MKIKYKGGRSHYKISLNRKHYYFTLENKRILDIQDQNVVNFIFSMPNRSEFEVVVEEPQAVFSGQTTTSSEENTEVKIEKPKIKKYKSKKEKK